MYGNSFRSNPSPTDDDDYCNRWDFGQTHLPCVQYNVVPPVSALSTSARTSDIRAHMRETEQWHPLANIFTFDDVPESILCVVYTNVWIHIILRRQIIKYSVYPFACSCAYCASFRLWSLHRVSRARFRETNAVPFGHISH